MAKSEIKVSPAPFLEVAALLKSDALRAVQEPIATAVGMKIIYEYASANVSITQGEISVSGMSTQELEKYLGERREALIRFGVRFYRDQHGKPDEQVYPEGEEPDEQDKDKIVAVLGLGNGFGVKYAIYYHFQESRTPAELRDFLKNRRIPKAPKFARELRRIFDEVRPS